MHTARNVQQALREYADPKRAEHALRFFKTGKGAYGEGDRFFGATVPEVRRVAKIYGTLALEETVTLLQSSWHEDRLCALILLTACVERGGRAEGDAAAEAYLAHLASVNNWDLVDTSAAPVLGPYFSRHQKAPLFRMARSRNMWKRRVAMITTLWWIRQGKFTDALRVAQMLLHDKEDLIHKAVGWMLREVGKRSRDAEEAFLLKHYHTMPRTMLRCAIELFPDRRRQAYLAGSV